jgi:hypothetical protein
MVAYYMLYFYWSDLTCYNHIVLLYICRISIMCRWTLYLPSWLVHLLLVESLHNQSTSVTATTTDDIMSNWTLRLYSTSVDRLIYRRLYSRRYELYKRTRTELSKELNKTNCCVIISCNFDIRCMLTVDFANRVNSYTVSIYRPISSNCQETFYRQMHRRIYIVFHFIVFMYFRGLSSSLASYTLFL